MNKTMDPVELKEHIRDFLKEHRQASWLPVCEMYPVAARSSISSVMIWISMSVPPVEKNLKLLPRTLQSVYWSIQSILITGG